MNSFLRIFQGFDQKCRKTNSCTGICRTLTFVEHTCWLLLNKTFSFVVFKVAIHHKNLHLKKSQKLPCHFLYHLIYCFLALEHFRFHSHIHLHAFIKLINKSFFTKVLIQFSLVITGLFAFGASTNS